MIDHENILYERFESRYEDKIITRWRRPFKTRQLIDEDYYEDPLPSMWSYLVKRVRNKFWPKPLGPIQLRLRYEGLIAKELGLRNDEDRVESDND